MKYQILFLTLFLGAFGISGVSLAQQPPILSEDALSPSQVSAADVAQAKMPLSLNSAVLYALSDNPDIRMAGAREEQAEANIDKSRAGYFPILDFVIEGGREWNDPASGVIDGSHSNYSNHANLTLQQLVYDWNKTRAGVRQQKQLEASSKIDTQAQIEQVLNNTIENYLSIYEFQKNLAIQTEFVERITQLTGVVKQMYEAGASGKTIFDYANSRLAAAETANNTLRANLNDAVSNLEYLTGPLPPFEVSAPEDLDPANLDLKSYISMAEEKNTGVQLSASDLKALAYRLEATKKELYPTISLVASYDQKYNDGGESDRDQEAQAYLQMNYRLYDGGVRENDIKLVRSQMAEAEINQEKIIKELRRLIKQSYNQITASQESRRQTMKEIASSEALQALNRQNFLQGSISVIELLEGEERLNNARATLTTQDSQLFLNTYRLLITAGILKQNFFCDSCHSKTASAQ